MKVFPCYYKIPVEVRNNIYIKLWRRNSISELSLWRNKQAAISSIFKHRHFFLAVVSISKTKLIFKCTGLMTNKNTSKLVQWKQISIQILKFWSLLFSRLKGSSNRCHEYKSMDNIVNLYLALNVEMQELLVLCMSYQYYIMPFKP